MSFKIYFQANNQQEFPDVRRLGVVTIPSSFEAFCKKLSELFPGKYHPELLVQYNDEEGDFITVTSEVEWQEALALMANENLKKFYIRDSNVPHFKDSVFAPEPKYFYESSSDNNEKRRRRCRKGKKVHVSCNQAQCACPRSESSDDERLKRLSDIVPRILAGLFEGGKILPFAGFPEWLKPVVRVQRHGQNDADLDINVDVFPKVLHSRGLFCLEAGQTEEAKKMFQALVQLEPTDAISWYNFACCDSISAEKAATSLSPSAETDLVVHNIVSDALSHLKLAFDNGYNNVNHTLADPDLKFIRQVPAFLTLIDSFSKRSSVPSPNFRSFGIVIDNNNNNNSTPADGDVDMNNNNVCEANKVEDEEEKKNREAQEAALREHQKWLAEEEAKIAEQRRIAEEEQREKESQAEQLAQLAEQMQKMNVKAEEERRRAEEEAIQKRREEEEQEQRRRQEEEAKQQEQKKNEVDSNTQKQLQQLADMGFNDIERNTVLLRDFNGDLAEVLQVLLGQ